MRKRQILWAVVFGAMLTMTGCGDDPAEEGGGGGSAGSAGSGGSAGSVGSAGSGGGDASSFCATLCESCGGGASAQCASECEAGFADAGTGIDFESCPSELNALGSCLDANNCSNDACGPQFSAYILCIVGIPF